MFLIISVPYKALNKVMESCVISSISQLRKLSKMLESIPGTIFQRSHQIIEYADDLDIIARNQRDLETVFQGLEGNARELGLEVN
jgi:hypothetical protein